MSRSHDTHAENDFRLFLKQHGLYPTESQYRYTFIDENGCPWTFRADFYLAPAVWVEVLGPVHFKNAAAEDADRWREALITGQGRFHYFGVDARLINVDGLWSVFSLFLKYAQLSREPISLVLTN